MYEGQTRGPAGAGLPPAGPSPGPSPGPPGTLSLLAVVASLLLCWIFYRVRMRQCEAVLREMARALDDVRRTAEALQTRSRVVKAATATAERALVEYNAFLNMLHQMQEGDGLKPDLPILRHQIELETMRAQVSMVQGCLLAMSQEVLSLGPHPAPGPLSASEQKQENILTSLHQHRKSYIHMSEELLTLLDDKHCSERASSACS